jgi:hypothetical protein
MLASAISGKSGQGVTPSAFAPFVSAARAMSGKIGTQSQVRNTIRTTDFMTGMPIPVTDTLIDLLYFYLDGTVPKKFLRLKLQADK